MSAIRYYIPGTGGGGATPVLTAPGAFNATATGNAVSTSWLAAPVPALTKGVRIYGQRVSEASDTYQPATWTVLDYCNTGTSSVDRSYIWSGDPINLRACYIGIDNSEGPFSYVNNVSVNWGPTDQVSLYSEDFSQAATWVPDSGVVVTSQGASLGYQINFGAANKAFTQKIPCYTPTGRTYTIFLEVKGTPGQTISYFAHEFVNTTLGSTFQGNVTLGNGTATTNGFEVFAITRPTTGTSGRTISFGLQTYNSATATSVIMRKYSFFQGTQTLSYCQTNYATTTGPGSCRQEAVYAYTGSTWTGWFHSDTPSVPTINIDDGPVTVAGARLSGLGTIIKGTSGTPSLTYTNSRAWAMHPLQNSLTKGYHVDLAYPRDLTATNNSFRSGMGVRYKFARNSATVCLVKNNVHRDPDGRICTSGGSYVQSSYSNIQNRPPGAPLGNNVTNFFQAQGSFDGENAVNPPVPPQGIDVDGNEVTSRPGYGKIEDVISCIQCRGNATTPYFVRNNMIYANMPWDFVWHATSNPATPYNFGNIKTTFNLLLTVGAGGAAISATTITLTQGNNLVSYSIPNGTVLTFTGGKTATVNGNQTGNGGSLTVLALAAALNAGDTATITGVQDGPGAYSGTAIMLGDGIRGPTNVNYAWERQTRWGRAENNLTLGPSAIQSICIGTDIEIRSGLILNTVKMIDGTLPDDNSRNGFYQVNTFSQNAATALDGTGTPQLISARYGINNSKGYNGGVSFGSGGADNVTGYSYGNKNISATYAWKDAMMAMADWRTEKAALGLTIGPTS